MDDPGYAQKAARKIEAYAENGFDAGHRLLLTFETGQSGLNMKHVKFLAEKHLLIQS